MARKQSKPSLVFAPRVIRAFLGSHGVLGLIDGMCRRSLRTPTHYNMIV